MNLDDYAARVANALPCPTPAQASAVMAALLSGCADTATAHGDAA